MFLVEEGLFTSCSRQSFPIVLFHLHFLALGWTDLEFDNCIKSRHIQTTFLPKIRFIWVEVFLKIEVNQIGSTFHSCEPNWVPHWYVSTLPNQLIVFPLRWSDLPTVLLFVVHNYCLRFCSYPLQVISRFRCTECTLLADSMDPDNDADAEPQHEGFEQASIYKNDADVPIPTSSTASGISIYSDVT